MLRNLRRRTMLRPLIAVMAVLSLTVIVDAQSNVDATNKFGWGENMGWTNWRDAGGTTAGVNVGSTVMGGFVWGENVGFINVGDGTPTNGVNYANVDGTDFGINIDADGDLHGFAWGENIGWINFDGGALATPPLPARIECAAPPGQPLARLVGYVWGENVGWINLDDLVNFVSVDAATTPIDCDMDHNGVPNGLDIQLFVNFVLMTDTPDWRDVCSGDLEAVPDSMIDFDDVVEFVDCLLN
ncbi:MAG: hypothetical protein MI923_09260 [Phycisphaerales bacterium]|nr:hypothetical protein [Phycisphaerales bacterium]